MQYEGKALPSMARRSTGANTSPSWWTIPNFLAPDRNPHCARDPLRRRPPPQQRGSARAMTTRFGSCSHPAASSATPGVARVMPGGERPRPWRTDANSRWPKNGLFVRETAKSKCLSASDATVSPFPQRGGWSRRSRVVGRDFAPVVSRHVVFAAGGRMVM